MGIDRIMSFCPFMVRLVGDDMTVTHAVVMVGIDISKNKEYNTDTKKGTTEPGDR